VSDELDVAATVKPSAFPDGFSNAYYLIDVMPDKFNAQKFRQAVSATGHDSDASLWFFPSRSGSHLAILSFVEDETGEFNFRIEYEVVNAHASAFNTPAEPTAETLIEWFGQFFKYDTAHAHLHAHFRFAVDKRRSVYPLPVRTNFGDADEAYEIFGITVRMPSRPKGVTTVRLTQGKADWFVEVIADRRIAFRTFSPDGDLTSISHVIDKFFLETKP
jgi:hypothetical protein